MRGRRAKAAYASKRLSGMIREKSLYTRVTYVSVEGREMEVSINRHLGDLCGGFFLFFPSLSRRAFNYTERGVIACRQLSHIFT